MKGGSTVSKWGAKSIWGRYSPNKMDPKSGANIGAITGILLNMAIMCVLVLYQPVLFQPLLNERT